MRRPLLLAALALALAPLSAPAARVQAPDAPWRTIVTAHYRIHYPARPEGGFEPFAREVAARVEGIHAAVVEEVGNEAKRPVQVVIRDPIGEANGLALPLLAHPYVELWRTEPESDSPIAAPDSWVALLVVHELTHIHHLAWPARQPRLLDRFLPAGPVALKAPRWVAEGYATLVEGRLTGAGRPHGAYRAALLRQWAAEGKLPPYDSLSRLSGFRGGSMAYLVGSAYLEWLERRSPDGPASLRRLWRQLASRRHRRFDDAFAATFGLSPRDGYDRFRAEVTRDALEVERRLGAAGLCEGEPWLKARGELTDLAVSPDGTRLLARSLSSKDAGLHVYDVLKPPRRRSGKPVDPGLGPDVPPQFPVRKPAATRPRIDGATPRRPAWLADGRVAFWLKEPDGEGTLVARPWVWTPGGATRRGAPAEVPAPVAVAGAPGRRAATIGTAMIALPFEPVGPLAVDASGRFLYGAAAVDGIWNVVRVPLRRDGSATSAGPVEVLTRTTSACWDPAPSPDGRSLFFTRLSATGVEVRRLVLGPGAAVPEVPLSFLDPMTQATVLAPPPGPDLLPSPVEPPPARPYSPTAESIVSTRSGLSITPSGTSWQVGAGGSDVLGQLSWQLLAGFGDPAGPRGARASAVLRRSRWAPSLELFSSLERPSDQRFVPVQGADRQRAGAELGLTWRDLSPLRLELAPALALERVFPLDDPSPAADRLVATLSARAARTVTRGDSWGATLALRGTVQGGWSGGEGIGLARAAVELGVKTPLGWLGGEAEAGRASGGTTAVDRFRLGGPASPLVPGSLEAGLLEVPALPSSLQTGDRLLLLRATWGRTVRLALLHAAVWEEAGRPPFARVVSLEASLGALTGSPLLVPFVGHLDLSAGLHRTLDGAMAGRTVATVVLSTRP